jgi:dTMP kinase
VSALRRKPGRGRFIVLEGLDGAGTTTQLERLSAALRAEGHSVLATREPSNGPVGTMIRQILTGRLVLPGGAGPMAPETIALLYAADRTDHLKAEVLPALEAGQIVISDRYVLSSLAYQGASLSMAWVEAANAYAVPPDLTLFVHVSPAVAAQRRAARGGARELFEEDALQRRIARQYEEAIRRREAQERIVRIDGEQPVEQVTEAALAEIHAVLGRKRAR